MWLLLDAKFQITQWKSYNKQHHSKVLTVKWKLSFQWSHLCFTQTWMIYRVDNPIFFILTPFWPMLYKTSFMVAFKFMQSCDILLFEFFLCTHRSRNKFSFNNNYQTRLNKITFVRPILFWVFPFTFVKFNRAGPR